MRISRRSVQDPVYMRPVRSRTAVLVACVAARLSLRRKWVCVITNKSVFWVLLGCTILYNRFWLPHGFLHCNETRDWLAYLHQSSTFSVSMFWFWTWVWQINLAGRCAYSLLRNAIFASRKSTNLWKAKGNSTFYQKYRSCRLTYREAANLFVRGNQNVLHKIMQPCKAQNTDLFVITDPLSLTWKSGCNTD